MFAFKFRTVRGEKYVDVRLFAGDNGKQLQLAGGVKLHPDEWNALRDVLKAGEACKGIDAIVHFEEVV